MPAPEDVMRYAMEDAAWGHFLYAGNDLSLASIAISLKRIADALDGTMLGIDASESLAGLTTQFIRRS